MGSGGSVSAINWIVDGFHVSTSDEQIIKDIERRIKPGTDPKVIKKYIKEAIKRHRENQKLYSDVVNGRIGR
jgi:hypothetical protein